MDVLERYEWLFLLLLVAAATLVLWARDLARARGDRAQQRRASRRALTFLFWAGLPWAVIGVGVVSGRITTLEDAFNLNHGVFPRFVIASVVAVWVALVYWLFKRGGAEELAASGQVWFGFSSVREPSSIKLLFIAALAGGVVGLVALVLASTR
jgi:hypothetical protein